GRRAPSRLPGLRAVPTSRPPRAAPRLGRPRRSNPARTPRRFRRPRWPTHPTPQPPPGRRALRSEEHTSELQSRSDLVCRLLLADTRAPPSPPPLPYTTLFRSWAASAQPPPRSASCANEPPPSGSASPRASAKVQPSPHAAPVPPSTVADPPNPTTTTWAPRS